MFKPRPNQLKVAQFKEGLMGVIAVPGSGKTHTLSFLAANLISQGLVDDDQEVLIVTLVNSAVDNFAQRIAGFMHDFGLLPNIGYRVRTLHGLAHDIVKGRPQLVNLDEHFKIADERETIEIITNITHTWLLRNSGFIDQYKNQGVSDHTSSKMRTQWEDLLVKITTNFIKQAKDLGLTPEITKDLIKHKDKENLLTLGVETYSEYQRILNSRGSVDFEDLISLALKALNSDADYSNRLQKRWPYILEDEAQDSSATQEKILRLLVGKNNSWVRVGDPNQSIYETFTMASPQFLNDFIKEKNVIACDLPNSGRSTMSIIDLANTLIQWTNEQHPNIDVKNALRPPFITPTPVGDPQPNPPDHKKSVIINKDKLHPEREIQLVTRSVKSWLNDHPDQTAAILVPRNDRGAEIVSALQANQVKCIELLQTSQSTRQTARTLKNIICFFADPSKSTHLAEMFESIYSSKFEDVTRKETFQYILKELRRCKYVENFLSPTNGVDWLEFLGSYKIPEWIHDTLSDFRKQIIDWQKAALLPIDQFILVISSTIFYEIEDLAIAYKLAMWLERSRKLHPDWGLSEFVLELEAIAANRTKLLGFSDADIGFDPDKHKGEVVVSTYHKSKGLEWDRVYLLSVNNYDFPSAQENDQFISEKWFIRDHLNLEAEAIAGLKELAKDKTISEANLKEGQATLQARLDYCAERLRLFYVGITRARKELIITWNSGRYEKCEAALPLKALIKYREESHGNPE